METTKTRPDGVKVIYGENGVDDWADHWEWSPVCDLDSVRITAFRPVGLVYEEIPDPVYGGASTRPGPLASIHYGKEQITIEMVRGMDLRGCIVWEKVPKKEVVAYHLASHIAKDHPGRDWRES